jgi:hypothetical protein
MPKIRHEKPREKQEQQKKIAEALGDILKPETTEEIAGCKTKTAAIDRACEALLTERGITNPAQLLVERGIIEEGFVPRFPEQTVQIIERIIKISGEIAEKIEVLETLHTLISKFHEAVLGRAINWHHEQNEPINSEEIRTALFESISIHIFDSDQKRCDAILKGRETTEDPTILAVLEFRKQFRARLPEILGKSN